MIATRVCRSEALCLAERLLDPPALFVKYNRNNGDAMELDVPEQVDAGALDKQRWRRDFDVAQAFSHFTCDLSGWSEVLLDLQGVGTALTDVAVATTEHEMGVAGTTDIGEQAVLNFMNVHHCRTCQHNPVCALLAKKYRQFELLDPRRSADLRS